MLGYEDAALVDVRLCVVPDARARAGGEDGGAFVSRGEGGGVAGASVVAGVFAGRADADHGAAGAVASGGQGAARSEPGARPAAGHGARAGRAARRGAASEVRGEPADLSRVRGALAGRGGDGAGAGGLHGRSPGACEGAVPAGDVGIE